MHINEHEKALQWAEHVLASNIVAHQIVVETPWSVVYKIETPQNVVYLKQVPEALFLEPDILTFLHHQGCKNIPEIIAVEPGLHCFLTKSCGNASLRELFKRKVNFPLLARGVESYTTIQRQLFHNLQKHGFNIAHPPKTFGIGTHSFSVFDPNGIEVEFTYHPPMLVK